jgi:hypothetical protein
MERLERGQKASLEEISGIINYSLLDITQTGHPLLRR